MTAVPDAPVPDVPASGAALDMTRRDERALSMRVAGIPIERVAATFGWTPEQAHEAVERALMRVTVDRNPEGVRHHRNLTQRRLDGLLEAIWPSATDPSGHPLIQQGAVKATLGIIDRQTALFGSNAPKESIVTHNVGPDQVAATIERLFKARSGVEEVDVLGVKVIQGEIDVLSISAVTGIADGDVLEDDDEEAPDVEAAEDDPRMAPPA